MLEDEDQWPVRCPSCGGTTLKQIGWLKTHTSLNCIGCGATLGYYRERMARDLDDAHRAIDSFSRGLRVERTAN